MTERLNANLDFDANIDDFNLDTSLRPQSLDEYIGQTKVKEKIKVFITAAKNRNEVLDHCLFSGPPGLGKTSLANILACEMNVPIKSTSGPVIERPGDLAALLTNLEPGSILFIDEIHRLNPVVEEFLYPAMEDYQIDIMIGQGPSAKSVKLDLPKFTLVGATTRAGLLTSPLRDRFGIVERLEFYQPEDLQKIILRSAQILNIPINTEGAMELAQRSRGTPRIVNRLLKRVRDYAEVKAEGLINQEIAHYALDQLEIDHNGLDQMDRNILKVIVEKYQGGPVGIDTIASSLNEEKNTLEDVYEPYLIQEGFIHRTPRGRVATPKAFEYLDIPIKSSGIQNDLF